MCQFLRRAHGVNLLKNVVGVSLKNHKPPQRNCNGLENATTKKKNELRRSQTGHVDTMV